MLGRCGFHVRPSFRRSRVDRVSSFRHGRVSGVKEVGISAGRMRSRGPGGRMVRVRSW